jgi:hypothetical protein
MSRLLGLLLIFLTACQASTPFPTASPPVIALWQVQFTPALRWLTPTMSACTQEQASTSLLVFERPAPSFEKSGTEFSLRWGAPARMDGFAAVLGYDELVIITHPNNPLKQISLADLKGIFSGKIQKWQEMSASGSFKGQIQTWIFPAGDDISQVMTQAFGFERTSPGAFFAPDPETMLMAVASDPQAIGYVPKHWLNKSVQSVEVSGLLSDKLRQPLLAISPEKPQSSQQQWLVCLQQQSALQQPIP